MDRRKPHYDLARIKRTFADPLTLAITRTALRDAQALGFTTAMIVEVIQSIEPNCFYKSMTSNNDASIWQDVYRVPWKSTNLYVKFTDNGRLVLTLLSFKEL